MRCVCAVRPESFSHRAVGTEPFRSSVPAATSGTHLLHLDKALLFCLYPYAILLFCENLAELLILLDTGFLVRGAQLLHLLLRKFFELTAGTGHVSFKLCTAAGRTGTSRARPESGAETHSATPHEQRVCLHLLDFLEIELVNLLILLFCEGKETVHMVCDHFGTLLYGHLFRPWKIGTIHSFRGSFRPLGGSCRFILGDGQRRCRNQCGSYQTLNETVHNLLDFKKIQESGHHKHRADLIAYILHNHLAAFSAAAFLMERNNLSPELEM